MIERDLGKTGVRLPVLGLGTYHLRDDADTPTAVRIIRRALELGMRYIDTAEGYGSAMDKIATAIRGRRHGVFLAAKTWARTYDEGRRVIETLLRRLGTDYLDSLAFHEVSHPEWLERISGPNGSAQAFLEAREKGYVRFISLSSHWPGTYARAIRDLPLDTVMLVINYLDRFSFPEIERDILPLALDRGLGVVAMKIIGDGLLRHSHALAVRYALSRPVSLALVGASTEGQLASDVAAVDGMPPWTAEDERAVLAAGELGTSICRQCGQCLPCPVGLDIPLLFRLEGLYDRQLLDRDDRPRDEMELRRHLAHWFETEWAARAGYGHGPATAVERCTGCGECNARCPWGLDVMRRLAEVAGKLGAPRGAPPGTA